ncbi:MAG: tRNA pseudouridine(38-40) synthase TruA [Desulfovibrio sp.]|nr:tRNA pseudouridine(38-40) synthase TruA [Desulfovibrio sp.]
MRYRLLLSYLGSNYHGWQLQASGGPPTIQGLLEEKLGIITRRAIRVIGAGRTDAGVHALGQNAHVDLPELAVRDLAQSLNALLPWDIRILRAVPTDNDFHARFQAQAKTYVYRFWTERAFLPPQLTPFVWQTGPLDFLAMQKALPYLLGRHDFSSVENSGSDLKTHVRTILQARLRAAAASPYLPEHAPELIFKVTADGFLKQMVRNLAGLLVLVGQKRLAPEALGDILAQRSRAANPAKTAPAKGLTLARIFYPNDPLLTKNTKEGSEDAAQGIQNELTSAYGGLGLI